ATPGSCCRGFSATTFAITTARGPSTATRSACRSSTSRERSGAAGDLAPPRDRGAQGRSVPLARSRSSPGGGRFGGRHRRRAGGFGLPAARRWRRRKAVALPRLRRAVRFHPAALALLLLLH